MNDAATPPTPPTFLGRLKRGLGWTVLILAVLAGVAGLVMWPEIEAWVTERFIPQTPVAQIDAPTPSAPAPAPAPVAGPAVTAPVPLDMEERLARLEKGSADARAVLSLVERLDRLDQAVHDLQSHRKADAALVLAIALLKEAVDRGQPFDSELRALKVLAPDDADIAKVTAALKPRAAGGIPSRMVLLGRFDPLEATLIRADFLPAATGDGTGDWQRRALERVLTLFTLRREDGQMDGSTTPAIVARAHWALAHDDWADALLQLAGLSGEAAKAAQDWVADAHARLEADRALSDLAADAVAAAGAKL